MRAFHVLLFLGLKETDMAPSYTAHQHIRFLEQHNNNNKNRTQNMVLCSVIARMLARCISTQMAIFRLTSAHCTLI